MAAASAVSRPCDDGSGRRPGDGERRIRCGSRSQALLAVGSGNYLSPSLRRFVRRAGGFRIGVSGVEREDSTSPDHRTRIRDPPLRHRASQPDFGQSSRPPRFESACPVPAARLDPLSRQPRVGRDAGARDHRHRNRASSAAPFVRAARARRGQSRTPAGHTE